MNFIKSFSDYSIVTGEDAEQFNLTLKETIEGYQQKGYPVDIKYSTCSANKGSVCYSALVLAYKPVKV